MYEGATNTKNTKGEHLVFTNSISTTRSTAAGKLENMLGLTQQKRIKYSGRSYCTYLSTQHAEEVESTKKEPSILQLVESWIEQIPFLADGGSSLSSGGDGVSNGGGGGGKKKRAAAARPHPSPTVVKLRRALAAL